MKIFNLFLSILITSLFWACDNSIPMSPEQPVAVVEQDAIFEMIWATRMDVEMEIGNLAEGISCKDWYIRSGHYKFPAHLTAFNKLSGDKDWEYKYEGADNTAIVLLMAFKNVLICRTGKRLFGFDVNNQELLWEVNLNEQEMRLGRGTIASNNMFYLAAEYDFQGEKHTQHLIEFNIFTGDYRIVYSIPKTDFGYPGISPPVYSKAGDMELLIFNEYPNHAAPPQKKLQHLVAINLNTKEVVWKSENISEFFSSNSLHPPIIYNNKVITGGDWSMYAFDVNSGEKLWRYEFDYPWAIWTRSNHLIYGGKIYVNNSQKDVSCINPDTGDLIWNNSKGGPNCTDNMVYYEKEDLLVFTSWGYGSVMILDALTGETLHRERPYEDSQYNNDVVYDSELDMFFTSTYKHAIGFKVNKP